MQHEHPGMRLRVLMEQHEKTIRRFAPEIGVSVSGLCNFLYGRTGMTAKLATKLAAVEEFDMTAEQWMWAQALHDLEKVKFWNSIDAVE